MSRLTEAVTTTPPVTQGLIAFCVGLYLMQFLLDIDVNAWALSPARVIWSNEYYRIFTSPLFHLNPMHITMNMMSTYAINTLLEKRLGSLRILFIVFVSIVVTSFLHVFGAWLLNLSFGMIWLMRENSIGFSGVLFHLSVLECNLGTHDNRSVFGFFEVRASLYPWVMLILLQVIMPNISFAGHLAGILAGTLQLNGCPMAPSEYVLRRLDDLPSIRRLTLWPSFVATTSVFGSNSTPSRGFEGCNILRRYISLTKDTICAALFGRGYTANANIRLGRVNEEAQVDLLPKDTSHELSQIV